MAHVKADLGTNPTPDTAAYSTADGTANRLTDVRPDRGSDKYKHRIADSTTRTHSAFHAAT